MWKNRKRRKKIAKATSEIVTPSISQLAIDQPSVHAAENNHVDLSTPAIEQQNEVPPTNNSPLPATTTEHSQVSQQHYITKTKLPKLVLPRFKGDVTSFRSFWDSYESAVHKNSEAVKN